MIYHMENNKKNPIEIEFERRRKLDKRKRCPCKTKLNEKTQQRICIRRAAEGRSVDATTVRPGLLAQDMISKLLPFAVDEFQKMKIALRNIQSRNFFPTMVTL